MGQLVQPHVVGDALGRRRRPRDVQHGAPLSEPPVRGLHLFTLSLDLRLN
jgi:hypothetical protein